MKKIGRQIQGTLMGLCGVLFVFTALHAQAAPAQGNSAVDTAFGTIASQTSATASLPQHTQREIWLFGGSLLDCPSLAGAPCRETQDDLRQFALTSAAIDALTQVQLWPEERQSVRVLTHILLRRLSERLGQRPASLQTFWRELAATYVSRSGNDLSEAVARHGVARYLDAKSADPIVLRGDDYVASLSAEERNRIADYLSLGPLQPQVTLAPLLKEYLQQLAQRGSDDAPARLVMISAARDDALGSAAALLPAIRSVGLEADWLPLDAALVSALAAAQCDKLDQFRARDLGRYHLAQYYPELAAEQLAFCRQPAALDTRLSSAQGVLLLDGSVALLQASMQQADGKLQPWARTLRQRFLQGELLIAAAGAAAQFSVGQRDDDVVLPIMQSDFANSSAPLVQRWCQQERCDDSFHRKPGLGLFPYGTIDTYTADLGREYRLLRATAAEAGVGFGIDADTVLRVRWDSQGSAELQVLGDGAVLFTDTRQAQYDADQEEWQLRTARVSRLVPGSVMHLTVAGSYQLVLPPTHVAKPQQLLPPSRLVDPYFFRAWTQWFVANGLPYAEAEYHVYPLQALLRLQRPEGGLHFFSSTNGLVGYRDLLIDLSFSHD